MEIQYYIGSITIEGNFLFTLPDKYNVNVKGVDLDFQVSRDGLKHFNRSELIIGRQISLGKPQYQVARLPRNWLQEIHILTTLIAN